MAKLDLLIGAADEAQREFTFALDGLSDEDLWKRADPRLLSVGEIAGHIAYWEAVSFLASNDDPNPDDLAIKSPLINRAFRYFTTSVEAPFKLDLSTLQVGEEMKKIHTEAMSSLVRLDPDKDDAPPSRAGWTWGALLQYLGFHIAYHTGQAYSVRHLLGHTTPDN